MEFIDLPPMLRATGTVRLPGSKSISNRVLLLAALAEGDTLVEDLLDSDDTRVMRNAIVALGLVLIGCLLVGRWLDRRPARTELHLLGWAGLGAALVVVEHDVPLIRGVADRIVAMDQGGVIADGAPDAVLSDAAVVASYLGSDQQVIARSGDTAG